MSSEKEINGIPTSDIRKGIDIWNQWTHDVLLNLTLLESGEITYEEFVSTINSGSKSVRDTYSKVLSNDARKAVQTVWHGDL